MPTPEELLNRLRAAGVNVDGKTWRHPAEGPGVRTAAPPPMIARQRELLTKLKGLLEQEVLQEKAKVVELTEKVQRLKHGGGS